MLGIFLAHFPHRFTSATHLLHNLSSPLSSCVWEKPSFGNDCPHPPWPAHIRIAFFCSMHHFSAQVLQILSLPLSNCLWEKASFGKVFPQPFFPAQMRSSSLVVYLGHCRLAPRSSCLCEYVSADTEFLHSPYGN